MSLGYSALRTGFAFLPFSAGIIVSAGLASQLMPRTGPKVPMVAGTVLTVVGLFTLTQIGLDTSYVSHVLPGELLMSIGLGLIFVPMSSLALIGVEPHDAGVASALVNATQQVGGSLGTALLNTVFATAVTNYVIDHGASPQSTAQAQISGYTTAFVWGAVLILLALATIVVLVRAGKDEVPAQAGAVHAG